MTSCHIKNCENCARKKRWAFFFDKYKRKIYWAEIIFLFRKIVIGGISIFFTKRTSAQMILFLGVNMTFFYCIVRYRPYLNDGDLTFGEEFEIRGKCCGLGINNFLEINMAMGEMILSLATIINAAMGMKHRFDTEACCATQRAG